jgi:CRP/FNR family transcriptional regulator, nitrogen fixation regulation protein
MFRHFNDPKVSSKKYHRDAKVFEEAEQNYVYQVIESPVGATSCYPTVAARSARFTPGDIFGYDNGDFHRFTAEAVVDTTLHFVERQRLAKTDPAMVRTLLTMTTANFFSTSKTICCFWDARPRKNAWRRFSWR